MYKLTYVAFLLVALLQKSAFGQGDVAVESTTDFLPSRLLQNVVDGKFDEIELALTEDKENIDLTNANGWSAARFAVAGGDIDMLNFLIKHGIDLNNPDVEGVTPLMVAAAQADKELVEALLAANASPLMVASDGSTAYSVAVAAGRKLVALLVAEASALHGIEMDDSNILLKALEEGAYVNIRNSAGWTPLMFAANKGDLETVKAILNYGADANRNENDGWTALHFAAVGGYVEIADALVKANADYTIQNSEGKTAREKAQEFDHLAVVEVIPQAPAPEL